MCLGVIGPRLDGRMEMMDGFVELTERDQNKAQVMMRFGVIRPRFKGRAKLAHGGVQLAPLPQYHRPIVVGVGVIGLSLDGRAVAGLRVVELAEDVQGDAEIVTEARVVRAEVNRVPEAFTGEFLVAGLVPEHALQIDRVGVERFHRQQIGAGLICL